MMHFSQLELGQERSQAWRRVRKEPELQLLRCNRTQSIMYDV